LPGGAGLAPAKGLFCPVSAPPTGNSKLKSNTTRPAGMMKKILGLGLVGPLLVCCFSKNGDW
ncbi:hypothetical protein, partial [Enterobacter intestinihominis]